MAQKERKYLLMWDRIGDYHRARWQALAQIVGQENVFAADLGAADNLYLWANTETSNKQYCLLSEKPVHQADFFTRINRFLKLVKSNKIDTICVPGYGRLEYIAMLFLARLMGKKVILFAESWYGNNKAVNTLKGILLKLTCNSYLVSGVRAAQHFEQQLGIAATQIRIGYSVVDNQHFAQASNTAKPSQPVILCVARFSPEKNLQLLIEAFKSSKLSHIYTLQLVGGGHLSETLKSAAAANPNIHLDAWLSYQELPALYAQASVFVLPSSFEPWGLVVNEAMSAGLPLVLSEECGCKPDLLSQENGFSFPAQNQQALTAIFDKISELSAEQLHAMGEISRSRINEFSPTTWAKSIVWFAEN